MGTLFVLRAVGKGNYRKYELDGAKIIAAWPVNKEDEGRKTPACARPSEFKGEQRKNWRSAISEFANEGGKSFNWDITDEEKVNLVNVAAAEKQAKLDEIDRAVTGHRIELCCSSKIKRSYVAKITGSDATYRFNREFLDRVGEVGKKAVYSLNEDGIYELRSAKSKKKGLIAEVTTKFVELKNGKVIELEREVIETLFPEVDAESRTQSRVCYECGRPGHLIEDLEDGLFKHYGCCDIPS